MSREQSPSMHESHDEPDFGQLSTPDRELIAQWYQGLDARIRDLEAAERARSTPPPGGVEVVKDGSKWRARSPTWAAIVLAFAILAGMALKEINALRGIFHK